MSLSDNDPASIISERRILTEDDITSIVKFMFTHKKALTCDSLSMVLHNPKHLVHISVIDDERGTFITIPEGEQCIFFFPIDCPAGEHMKLDSVLDVIPTTVTTEHETRVLLRKVFDLINTFRFL